MKTLQPYNFRALPPEMQDKAEKMIADICPLGEVNEWTVDAVEAWSREDVLALMRAMYNEAREDLRSCPSIKGYIARDGHGSLTFSSEKPSRLEWCGWKLWKISRGTPAVVLPNTLFPDLRWEDEPREVEIIIKEAKK